MKITQILAYLGLMILAFAPIWSAEIWPAETRLVSVGTVSTDQDGLYHAVREGRETRHFDHEIDMFVRKIGDGSVRWGYVFIANESEAHRWSKIHPKYHPVQSGNFMDIRYKADFGVIMDSGKGLVFYDQKGEAIWIPQGNGRRFIPHWVVVWLDEKRKG